MRNATRTLLVALVATASLGLPITATADDDIPLSRQVFEAHAVDYEPTPPSVQIENATEEQREKVAHAMHLFEVAGLDLPPLVIRFSDDPADCEGNLGTYRSQPDGRPSIISICTKMRITLIHELAHAWDSHSLVEERRDAFTDLWHLDNWNDKSKNWHDRGSERAADTIAYTLLLDEPTDNQDILNLVCGYGALTGHGLPALAEASCS